VIPAPVCNNCWTKPSPFASVYSLDLVPMPPGHMIWLATRSSPRLGQRQDCRSNMQTAGKSGVCQPYCSPRYRFRLLIVVINQGYITHRAGPLPILARNERRSPGRPLQAIEASRTCSAQLLGVSHADTRETLVAWAAILGTAVATPRASEYKCSGGLLYPALGEHQTN
jgi:hypothetical protein